MPGTSLLPRLQSQGLGLVAARFGRVIVSGPREGLDAATWLILLAVGQAYGCVFSTSSVLAAAAYTQPHRPGLRTLWHQDRPARWIDLPWPLVPRSHRLARRWCAREQDYFAARGYSHQADRWHRWLRCRARLADGHPAGRATPLAQALARQRPRYRHRDRDEPDGRAQAMPRRVPARRVPVTCATKDWRRVLILEPIAPVEDASVTNSRIKAVSTAGQCRRASVYHGADHREALTRNCRRPDQARVQRDHQGTWNRAHRSCKTGRGGRGGKPRACAGRGVAAAIPSRTI